jgi:hypothetical protein
MEVMFSSETSGSLRTTRRHNPEDRNLHTYRRDYLKSNTIYVILYTMQKTISLCSFMSKIRSISVEKYGVSCKVLRVCWVEFPIHVLYFFAQVSFRDAVSSLNIPLYLEG